MTTNTSQRFFIYQYKYAKNGNLHECTTTVALTSASKFFLYSLTWHHFEDPRILLLKVGMKRLCNDLRLLRPNVIVSSCFKYLSTLLVETNGMFYEVSNGGHTEWLIDWTESGTNWFGRLWWLTDVRAGLWLTFLVFQESNQWLTLLVGTALISHPPSQRWLWLWVTLTSVNGKLCHTVCQ